MHRNNRVIFTLLIGAALSAAAAGAWAVIGSGKASAELDGTLKKARDTGVLTVGYRADALPFSYAGKDGRPAGYGNAVCRKIADEVGKAVGRPVSVKWVPITAANRIPLLLSGDYDIECGATTNTLERQKQVDFGTTYYRVAITAAVKSSAIAKSFKDLDGRTVSVTEGTTSVGLVDQLRDKGISVRVSKAASHPDNFRMLSEGRIDASVMDDVLLAGLIAHTTIPSDYKLIEKPLAEEPYGPMLRKDPQFKAVVDKTITGMMRSGELKKLYDAWFTQPIEPENVNLRFPMNRPTMKAFAYPNSEGV